VTFGSGYLGSFDRRKCESQLNGLNATGEQCPVLQSAPMGGMSVPFTSVRPPHGVPLPSGVHLFL
jgi:hypothetical protein